MAVEIFEDAGDIRLVLTALFYVGIFVSGIIIGAVGFGGVFIVLLLLFAGVHSAVAVTTALASFMFSSFLASILYARRGLISLSNAGLVCLSVIPGAALGTLLLPQMSDVLMQCIISVAALYSGGKTLIGSYGAIQHSPRNQTRDGPADFDKSSKERLLESEVAGKCEVSKPQLMKFAGSQKIFIVFVGIIVGVASVLTGTGGPFIFVPIMLLSYPTVPAAEFVAVSQPIAVIISVTATTVASLSTKYKMDMWFTLYVTACTLLGIPFGTCIATRVRSDVLKISVSGLLVICSLYIVAKIAFGLKG